MKSSKVFHRSLKKYYPTADRGNGVYIHTADGKKILDGCAGAALSSLGHGNKEVIQAIIDQAQSIAFAHTGFFTSNAMEKLAEIILQQSDDAFARAVFLCSGSEAVETALKLARQYHVIRGDAARVNYIARRESYHGNTLGALAASGNESRRATYAPILSTVFHHVSPCFYSRDGNGVDELTYEDRLIKEFEDKFQELGSHTISAVIVEPVVGATLGSLPATKTYLPRLKVLCERYGALIIFDEVMSGMGRIGSYHAWQSLGGVGPDLQTIGKGLAAGYSPMSSVLLSPKVHDVFQNAPEGSFISSHTYQGHTIGCGTALQVQTILRRDSIVSRVKEVGEFLASSLRSKLPEHCVGEVRGLGLFRTVDFGSLGRSYGGPVAAEVAKESFDQGAAVYLVSPTVDAIMFSPPYVISEEEVSELVRIFANSLETVLVRRKAKFNGEVNRL